MQLVGRRPHLGQAEELRMKREEYLLLLLLQSGQVKLQGVLDE